ncbi:MAG: hypothetical protein JSS65_06135 [Armatimonadetes bacterium]|nr:hypothetical protein [Armatimonadota bacterium]
MDEKLALVLVGSLATIIGSVVTQVLSYALQQHRRSQDERQEKVKRQVALIEILIAEVLSTEGEIRAAAGAQLEAIMASKDSGDFHPRFMDFTRRLVEVEGSRQSVDLMIEAFKNRKSQIDEKVNRSLELSFRAFSQARQACFKPIATAARLVGVEKHFNSSEKLHAIVQRVLEAELAGCVLETSNVQNMIQLLVEDLTTLMTQVQEGSFDQKSANGVNPLPTGLYTILDRYDELVMSKWLEIKLFAKGQQETS